MLFVSGDGVCGFALWWRAWDRVRKSCALHHAGLKREVQLRSLRSRLGHDREAIVKPFGTNCNRLQLSKNPHFSYRLQTKPSGGRGAKAVPRAFHASPAVDPLAVHQSGGGAKLRKPALQNPHQTNTCAADKAAWAGLARSRIVFLLSLLATASWTHFFENFGCTGTFGTFGHFGSWAWVC